MKKTTSKAIIQAAANYYKAHAEKKRADKLASDTAKGLHALYFEIRG